MFKRQISKSCVGCEALCGPDTNRRTCTEAIHSKDFQRVIKEENIKLPFIYGDRDKKTEAAVLVELVKMPEERKIMAKVERGVFFRRLKLGPIGVWI